MKVFGEDGLYELPAHPDGAVPQTPTPYLQKKVTLLQTLCSEAVYKQPTHRGSTDGDLSLSQQSSVTGRA